MKMISIILIALFFFGCSRPAITDSNTLTNFSTAEETESETDLSLEMQFAEIAKEAKGKVGVAAVEIETGRSAYLNHNEHFAMQSVVKLPISMAVMHRISADYYESDDTADKLTLDDKIKISKDEYVPSNMRSPLRDSKTTELTVRELIRYAISESDGTAADVLQRVAGDAKGVQAYIDSVDIAEMKVKYTHKEFGREWRMQYENWTTAAGSVALLKKFCSNLGINEVLEMHSAHPWKDNAEILLEFMIESNNPANRLKGLLPPEAIVAHKTGTGGTKDGVTSATNDVGIITLPNGKHVAIAVFVGDSSADEKTRAAVIAKIAKAVWDRWSE